MIGKFKFWMSITSNIAFQNGQPVQSNFWIEYNEYNIQKHWMTSTIREYYIQM